MEKLKLNNIIEKFLSGKNSEKEKHLLNRFYDSYENEIMEIDPVKEDEIKNQMKSNIFKASGIALKPAKDKYSIILKYAAVIAFFIIISSGVLYYLNIFGDKKHEIAWQEKITEYGQKATIDLTEGTKIILNAGSKLKYPEKFNGKPREVFLEGEALFNVAHNPENPFIVHTGGNTYNCSRN